MFCECGCGQVTPLADKTRGALGWIKGQPIRFIKGHNRARVDVEINEVTGCWHRVGKRKRERLLFKDSEGNPKYLYRVVYEALIGEFPEELKLDHLCRNPKCINPWHLEPVTSQVNTQRGKVAKLTPETALIIFQSKGEKSAAQLAQEHGVLPNTIYDVWKGRTWGNITGMPRWVSPSCR